MKTDLEMVLKLIQQRRIEQESIRDEDVRMKQWGNAAGREGIAVGLLMAEKIIQDEIALNPRT